MSWLTYMILGFLLIWVAGTVIVIGIHLFWKLPTIVKVLIVGSYILWGLGNIIYGMVTPDHRAEYEYDRDQERQYDLIREH